MRKCNADTHGLFFTVLIVMVLLWGTMTPKMADGQEPSPQTPGVESWEQLRNDFLRAWDANEHQLQRYTIIAGHGIALRESPRAIEVYDILRLEIYQEMLNPTEPIPPNRVITLGSSQPEGIRSYLTQRYHPEAISRQRDDFINQNRQHFQSRFYTGPLLTDSLHQLFASTTEPPYQLTRRERIDAYNQAAEEIMNRYMLASRAEIGPGGIREIEFENRFREILRQDVLTPEQRRSHFSQESFQRWKTHTRAHLAEKQDRLVKQYLSEAVHHFDLPDPYRENILNIINEQHFHVSRSEIPASNIPYSGLASEMPAPTDTISKLIYRSKSDLPEGTKSIVVFGTRGEILMEVPVPSHIPIRYLKLDPLVFGHNFDRNRFYQLEQLENLLELRKKEFMALENADYRPGGSIQTYRRQFQEDVYSRISLSTETSLPVEYFYHTDKEWITKKSVYEAWRPHTREPIDYNFAPSPSNTNLAQVNENLPHYRVDKFGVNRVRPPQFFRILLEDQIQDSQEVVPENKRWRLGSVHIKSMQPHLPTVEGIVFVPSPEKHSLNSLVLYDEQSGKQLKQGHDYFIRSSGAPPSYYVQLNEGLSEARPTIHLMATFIRDGTVSTFSRARQSVSRELLTILATELRQAGLVKISDKVELLSLRPGAVFVKDLERIVRSQSLYSFDVPSNFGGQLGSEVEGRFTPYRRFLLPDGTLCFQCDGANSLFRDMLSVIYQDQPEINVERHVGYSANFGTTYLDEMGLHQKTSLRADTQYLALDATPTREVRVGDKLLVRCFDCPDPRVPHASRPPTPSYSDKFRERRLAQFWRDFQERSLQLTSDRQLQSVIPPEHLRPESRSPISRIFQIKAFLNDYLMERIPPDTIHERFSRLYPRVYLGSGSPAEVKAALVQGLEEDALAYARVKKQMMETKTGGQYRYLLRPEVDGPLQSVYAYLLDELRDPGIDFSVAKKIQERGAGDRVSCLRARLGG